MIACICVSIGANKISEISSLISKAELAGANLIEIRLDYLENINGLERVIRGASVPLIATNRQQQQGGLSHQSERTRVRDLLKMAARGFSFADIELTTPNVKRVTEELIRQNVKPIVSFHDFEKTPKTEDLKKIIASQIAVGAEVCKIVATAKGLSDNLPLLSLVSETSPNKNIVCFAMGNEGILSRALSPIFGADFTYASLQEGLETASGQITIARLKKLYRNLGVMA